VALVESATQLLNVVEWSHAAEVPRPSVHVIILAPGHEATRLQLRAMASLARATGLVVQWHEPRVGGASTARTVRALADELAGTVRLVIGDPFSGVMQVMISIVRAAEVVIVDDGTATLEFARQWTTGEHLTRWHQVATPSQRRRISVLARDQIADSVRRRIAPGSGCRLSMFSCLPVDLPRVPIERNEFGWVRAQQAPPHLRPTGDLVGTSLVETGVVDAHQYVQAVAALTREHRVSRYFAHRKESSEKLFRIAQLGLQIVRPPLPLEVVARRGPIGHKVISFPSTVVHTLPLVLAGTGVEVLVCDVADEWLTPLAPPRSEEFLGEVAVSARDRHGIAAVAC
jgi:hypothetical protein